jgi:hypothetical protein
MSEKVVRAVSDPVDVGSGGDDVVAKFKDLDVYAWCDRKKALGQLSVRARPSVRGTELLTLERWEGSDDTVQAAGVWCASLKFKPGVSTEEVTQWSVDVVIGPCKYVVLVYGGAVVALVPVEYV